MVNSFLCVCVCVITPFVSWFDSELAGPQQNVSRTRCGGERDPAAEAQVLLLGPERGLAGPCAAQPAVCPGKATTRRLQTTRCSPSPAHAAQPSPACILVWKEVRRGWKRLLSLFCTRLSHQLSLAVLSDLKSVHKRRSATHHVCLFLAALLPLTACLAFLHLFSLPSISFPSTAPHPSASPSPTYSDTVVHVPALLPVEQMRA